jgi:hypothetical protein
MPCMLIIFVFKKVSKHLETEKFQKIKININQYKSKSKIKNQKSKIKNQKSKIKNQKSNCKYKYK